MAFFGRIEEYREWEALVDQRYDRITPFWFVLDAHDRYGPNNIGVSAFSMREAVDIIDAHAEILRGLLRSDGRAEVIPEIDLDLLDDTLVRPYIRDTHREGIWWPLLD
jgi:hypothetical protein